MDTIITTPNEYRVRPRLAWLAIVLCLLSGIACTNSKLVIGPLYNRLDNRMLDSIDELIELGDHQQSYLEQRIGTYHVWHRQQELPRYVALLDEISASTAPGQRASTRQIRDWFDRVYARADAARRCHPAHFAADGLRTLSDEQVQQFKERLAVELQEDAERRARYTREERQARRFDRAVKWSRRAGLALTDAQKARLQSAFDQQISLSQPFRAGADAWREQLLLLLDQRHQPDFPDRLATHLDGMWRWIERDRPRDVAANRQVWIDFAIDLEASLSDAQRRAASDWIAGLSATLKSVAADEPSFQVSGDPDLGCPIGTTAGERAETG